MSIISAILSACATQPSGKIPVYDDYHFTIEDAIKLRSNTFKMKKFSLADAPAPLMAYITSYDLDFPDTEYYAGYFEHSGTSLFGQVFRPPSSVHTIFFIHGYLDHSGLNYRLLSWLLGRGYTVAMFDLPGHGLSNGERAMIDDFASYGLAAKAFIKACDNIVPPEYSLMGHSTGCAAWIEYARLTGDTEPDYYFIAPIIRSFLWDLSQFGLTISSPFADKVFRIYNGSSHDKQLMEFMKKYDVLQEREIPYGWAYAVREYYQRLKNTTIEFEQLIVFQGKKDTIVDWAYNIPFILENFTGVKVHYFRKAMHCIHYEKPAIYNRFLASLKRYL